MRQNQNIFQNDYFRKFSENLFCWVHQVDIRELKNTNNSIAIDGLHNIRPNYLITYARIQRNLGLVPTVLMQRWFLVWEKCKTKNVCNAVQLHCIFFVFSKTGEARRLPGGGKIA